MRLADAPPLPPEFALSPSTAPIYAPSPVAEDMILSVANGPEDEFRVIGLMGPRGSGKTTAALYSIIALAQRIKVSGKGRLLPIRVAVVRDTWTNLKRTTLVSLEEAKARGLPIEWIDDQHEAVIPGIAHFYFFGLDNRADADKLQGFMCGVLWLEEVAPAADLASGIPVEAFAIGVTSVRQEGIPKRIIMPFNPPDEDHWVLSIEETLQESGQEDLIYRRFDMTTTDKSDHFRTMAEEARRAFDDRTARMWDEAAREYEAYMRRNKIALEAAGRHDLVDRLHGGKIGGVQIGEAIVPTFDRELHVTKDRIEPLPSAQMVRGWDCGLTPSTVWLQVTPQGNVDILGARTSVNAAMGEHILREVFPFQEKYGLRPPKRATGNDGWTRTRARDGWVFRDIADPAVNKGNEATKSEDTAAAVIENMLNTTVEPGPVAWSARRDALRTAFYRPSATKGRPKLIRIYGPECKVLVQGLGGRAHYPVNPATGRIDPSIIAAKRVSGIYFQPLDALAYPLAVLFPAEEWLKAVRAPAPRVHLPAPRSWVGV